MKVRQDRPCVQAEVLKAEHLVAYRTMVLEQPVAIPSMCLGVHDGNIRLDFRCCGRLRLTDLRYQSSFIQRLSAHNQNRP